MTLLEKARRGDAAAWERVVALYAPLVHRWCASAGLREADAEGVGHDVFHALSRALADPAPPWETASFPDWLRLLCRRVVDGYIPRPGEEPPTEAPTVLGGRDETRLSLDDRALLYRRAIELLGDGLPAATREAFWLLVEGRPAAAVAAELKAALPAVYTARSEVVRRMRDEFGDLLGDCSGR